MSCPAPYRKKGQVNPRNKGPILNTRAWMKGLLYRQLQ